MSNLTRVRIQLWWPQITWHAVSNFWATATTIWDITDSILLRIRLQEFFYQPLVISPGRLVLIGCARCICNAVHNHSCKLDVIPAYNLPPTRWIRFTELVFRGNAAEHCSSCVFWLWNSRRDSHSSSPSTLDFELLVDRLVFLTRVAVG